MLNALLISNNVAGLENYYVSSDLLQYTVCRITKDFDPDLMPYDLLVIPNGFDHVAMLKIKDKVRAFLDAGKSVKLTEWLSGIKPAPKRMTIDPALYGAGALI